MERKYIFIGAFCGMLISSVVGCSQKTDVNSELEKATKAFETANVTSAPPPTQSVQPVSTSSAPPAQSPAQEMNQAVASYKSGNLEDAVTRLQKLRSQTAMSADQLIAIQNATAAVMGEVYALAAKGDARARQAVQQYERMQNNQ